MSVRRHPSADLSDAARERLEALRADLLREAGRADPTDVTGATDATDATGTAAATSAPSPPPPLMPVPGRHAERRPRAAGRSDGRGWGIWASVLDRLPAGVTERPLGTAHVAVIAVVCGVLVTAGAWWALQLRGEAPVAAAPPTAATAGSADTAAGDAGVDPAPLVDLGAPAPGAPGAGTPGAEGAAATSSSTAMRAGTASVVIVDVAGRVRRPGLATLPEGSRVADAIESAGGARRGVDLTNLNLARVLVDGEQVLVGVAPAAGGAAGVPGVTAGTSSDPATGALVNLNTADQPTLETLPGVGPVTAAAILQWRTDHGAFTTVEELLEVSGIGPATLEDLAPLVTV